MSHDSFETVARRWQAAGLSRRALVKLLAAGMSAGSISVLLGDQTTSAQDSSAFPSGGPYSTLEEIGSTGGRLIEAYWTEPKLLNPLVQADAISRRVNLLLFNKLVQPHPDTGLPYPELATEVPSFANGGISEDGLTYRFHLRDDVIWHDGEPFTAADVVFTYQTLLNPDLASGPQGEVLGRVESVVAEDDYTVLFTLTSVAATFLINSMLGIVPEHIWKDVPAGDIIAHAGTLGDPAATIGTGPFRFGEWVRGAYLTFPSFPDFFLGAPALDEYVFKLVQDTTVMASQLQTGEADWVVPLSSEFVESTQNGENTRVAIYDQLLVHFYMTQLREAETTLFQDKRVRQALAYALDREAIEQVVWQGFSQVTHSSIPIASWAYGGGAITPQYAYDPGRAEALLDEAGWIRGSDGVREKDGLRFSFTNWTYAGSKQTADYITILQQQWGAIGIEVTPRTEDAAVWLDRINNTHDFEVVTTSYGFGGDPDQTNLWHSERSTPAGGNITGYANPEVDALLEAAVAELDPAVRKEIYLQFQNILAEELPAFPLSNPAGLDGLTKRVHNVIPNSFNPRWNAHTWWVDPE